MIVFIGWKLSTANLELINRLLLLEVFKDCEPVIIDLQSKKYKHDTDDTVIALGKKAVTLLQVHTWAPNQKRIALSHPDKWGSIPAKVEIRSQLESFMSSEPVNTSANSLPEEASKLTLKEELPKKDGKHLTAVEVKRIRDNFLDIKEQRWEGVTENGKTFKVTLLEEPPTHDINMTFTELWTITGLLEVFRAKELEIVYRNTGTQQSSSG